MTVDIRTAVNHNKFYWSSQHKLHVSVLLTILGHLNTNFKTQNKTYIFVCGLTNCTSHNNLCLPVPVAARSKAWVCDRWVAGTVGSNPTDDMDDCFLWVLCIVRRADHSSRGVLPTVMRRCVWSRNLKNEEAMAGVGPQRHRKENNNLYVIINIHIFFMFLKCGFFNECFPVLSKSC